MVATMLTAKAKSMESPDDDDQGLVGSKPETQSDKSVCCRGLFWCALIRTLFSLALLVVFAFLLAVQIAAMVYTEDDYQTIVRTTFEHPENVTFPAVTVCNYNGIQKSRFCEQYPNRCQKFRNGTYKFASNFSASDFYEVMTKMSEYESVRYRQKWEELVPKCLRVNPDEENGMECRHVRDIILNARYQNCFTFLTGEDKLTGAFERTGVYMNVNFQADEYVEDTPVGGYIFFHDLAKRVPDNFPRYLYALKPGMFYTYSLKQTTYERLPSPFTPGCKDYSEDNSLISSQKVCINQCMDDAYLTACECLPVSVPTFNPRDFPIYCENGNATRECLKKLDGRSAERFCQEACPISCSEKVYDVKVVAHKVPNYSNDIEKANREMSQVRIQFETNEIKVYSDDYPISSYSYLDLCFLIACLYALAVLFILMLTIKSMREVCGTCKSAPGSQLSSEQASRN